MNDPRSSHERDSTINNAFRNIVNRGKSYASIEHSTAQYCPTLGILKCKRKVNSDVVCALNLEDTRHRTHARTTKHVTNNWREMQSWIRKVARMVRAGYLKEFLSAQDLWLDQRTRLQNQALVLLLLLRQKGSTGGRLEDLADTLVGFGGAFEVFVGTNLLAHLLALLHCDWFLRCLC